MTNVQRVPNQVYQPANTQQGDQVIQDALIRHMLNNTRRLRAM